MANFLILLVLAKFTLSDAIDWANIKYIRNQAKNSQQSSSTNHAQDALFESARSSAAGGPWSVGNGMDVRPPSGDSHDYLSWAPYHWPYCNWCPRKGRRDNSILNANDSTTGVNETFRRSPARGMSRRRRRSVNILVSQPQTFVAVPDSLASPSAPPPAATAAATGPEPHEAAAKSKPAACTPSPTKSLPPSATWTTCPYVARDGKVNPDVRTLQGPSAINSASEAISYNAISYGLQPQTSAYSQNAVRFISSFFLDPSTRMNPNMNFGQVVRGPESGRQGTFTGVLDMRGIVQIANAIAILKEAGSPDWTSEREQALRSWMLKYLDWLITSDLGKSVAKKANNHATFYFVQVAAIQFLLGNKEEAAAALKQYFNGPFLNQIAKSGEQPFEAVRTRPYHYRCFNMEAMITGAKLGDELELDFWSAKSKYGTTIEDAVRYVMKLQPKGEDMSESFQHVAAVAAVYGDPHDIYASFLTKDPNYQKSPFYFYDQPEAYTKVQTTRKRVDARAYDGISYICTPDSELPDGAAYELDDGIYVNCDDLKPFYDIPDLEDSVD